MAIRNLTSGQLCAVLLSALTGPLLSNLTVLMTIEEGRNSPLVIAAISLAALILALLITKTTKTKKYNAPHLVLCNTYGKYIGTFCSFLITVAFLFGAAMTFRFMSYIISELFLPHTPIIVLTILLFIPVFYTTMGGIRLFGHNAGVAYLTVIVFLLMFLLPKEHYTISSIFPLWGDTPLNIQGFFRLFFLGAPLAALFFFLPFVSNYEKTNKALVIWVIISFALLIITYVLATSFFTPEVLREMLLPFYNLSSGQAGNLLERTDILYIVILFPAMGLTASFYFMSFFTAASTLCSKFKYRHRKIFILICSILVIIFSGGAFYKDSIWNELYTLNYIYLGITLFLLITYALPSFSRRDK